MLGQNIAYIFSGICIIVLTHYRKKSAVCVLIIVFLAVDQLEPPTVVIRNGVFIIAAFYNTQNELFIGISRFLLRFQL